MDVADGDLVVGADGERILRDQREREIGWHRRGSLVGERGIGDTVRPRLVPGSKRHAICSVCIYTTYLPDCMIEGGGSLQSELEAVVAQGAGGVHVVDA